MTTTNVVTTIPNHMLAQINEFALRKRITRAAAVRFLIHEGLKAVNRA